jgi:hypothetical protein
MQYKLAVASFSLSIFVRPLILTISPKTKNIKSYIFHHFAQSSNRRPHEAVTKLGIFKCKTVIAKSL